MSFKLPKLPYKYNALEPYIDEETMEIHVTEHHQKYLDGLEKLEKLKIGNKDLASHLEGLMHHKNLEHHNPTVLRKYGGGHFNHCLFWEFMSPESSEKQISERLQDRISADFGTLDSFKKQFKQGAMKVFGNGWCWWVYYPEENKSYIVMTKEQINPIMDNPKGISILGIDVWEHAYYLKYRSDREKYIDNWWNVVNWEMVSKVYDKIALKGKKVELTEEGTIAFETE